MQALALHKRDNQKNLCEGEGALHLAGDNTRSITVAKAREVLGSNGEKYSDIEIEKILNTFYAIANFVYEKADHSAMQKQQPNSFCPPKLNLLN